MGHTPGPWKCRTDPAMLQGRPLIVAEDGSGLILAQVTHGGKGNREGQLGSAAADGALMAAAPELLQACRDVEECLNGADLIAHRGSADSSGKRGQRYTSAAPLADKLRAAIAKAKGE